MYDFLKFYGMKRIICVKIILCTNYPCAPREASLLPHRGNDNGHASVGCFRSEAFFSNLHSAFSEKRRQTKRHFVTTERTCLSRVSIYFV